MNTMLRPQLDLDSHDLFLNRYLSQLQFNARVLEQALDESYPLLERLQFLLIFSSNIDEFYEIRVAGLKQQISFQREQTGPDGMRPPELLTEISRCTHQLIEKQYHILNDILMPAMEQEQIRFLRRRDWDDKLHLWAREYFRARILPVVSPIGLDPAHPFPRLVNKSLNFIVALEGKDAFGRDSGLAIVPAPRSLPRIIRVPDELVGSGQNFVFLSSLIRANLDDLFPGMAARGCWQFRITRNADLELDEAEVKDIARALRGELHQRHYGSAVRLEVAHNCPDELAEFLLQEFDLSEEELFRVNGPVNLKRLMELSSLLERPDLRHAPFVQGLPTAFKSRQNVFHAIRHHDMLLHHPFEAFTPIIDLLRQAAKDPAVLAIKMTLYRTGATSDIVNALVDAARNGKEVTAVIELRARFDEADNLQLASRLQEAGAVVTYGILGYKTHCKMLLIVRRESNQELVRYVHVGTGNYHARNAGIYTDYSLLTADPELCADIHAMFQQLTGMGKNVRMHKLFNAPFTLKKHLLDLIEQESAIALSGRPARIIAKVNGLTEPNIIKALYRASQAGVKIDLIVRGMCTLKPGMPGISDNIRVRSIVGRFLEHSRVFYFLNGTPQIYCASADLMERNLNQRLEIAFPIETPKLAMRVLKDLEDCLRDNCHSWELQPDGRYLPNSPAEGASAYSVQAALLERLKG